MTASALAVVLIAGNNAVAGVVVLGIALPLLLPAAYFLRAKVTVIDGVLTKASVFRRRTCSVESLGSIRPYATPFWYDLKSMQTLYLRGYRFQLADGTLLFKLSSAWWSTKEVAQLGQRLGIEIAGGPAAAQERHLILSGTPLELKLDEQEATAGSRDSADQTLGPGDFYDDLWVQYTELVASPRATDYRKSLRAAAETNRWAALLCSFQLMALIDQGTSVRATGVASSSELTEVLSKAQPSEAGVARAIEQIGALATGRDEGVAAEDDAASRALTARFAASVQSALGGSADPHSRLVALELEVKARVIMQRRAANRKFLRLAVTWLLTWTASSAAVLVYQLTIGHSRLEAGTVYRAVGWGLLVFLGIWIGYVIILLLDEFVLHRHADST